MALSKVFYHRNGSDLPVPVLQLSNPDKSPLDLTTFVSGIVTLTNIVSAPAVTAALSVFGTPTNGQITWTFPSSMPPGQYQVFISITYVSTQVEKFPGNVEDAPSVVVAD